MNVELRVIDVRGKGVLCSASSDTGQSFWLPRGQYVEWLAPPHPGDYVTAVVPEWLASKHRQLAGDVAYEGVRHANNGKAHTMSARPEDAGRGALFKNDQKEKPSHADYRGDITVGGRKFWLSGWIKEGKKGKYLSLSAKQAEERSDDRQQQRSSQRAPADSDIPF